MNENLKQRIESFESMVERGSYDCETWLSDNFTICIIRDLTTDKLEIVSVGVAKRNPNCDEDDRERGANIAYIRAIKDMGKWEDAE